MAETQNIPVAKTGPSYFGHHVDEAFGLCPRFYFYEFEAKLVPKDINWPQILGRGYHKALEAWYQGLKKIPSPNGDEALAFQEAALKALDDEMAASLPGLANSPSLQAELEIQQIIGHELMTGYWEAYPREPDWDILDTEREIALTIDGELFTFRLDLLVKTFSTNRVLVVDHKGSGEYAGPFFKKFRIDDQLTGYVKAASEIYNMAIDGVLINGLGKPPEAGKRRGGFPWYQRDIFLRSSKDIERWLLNRRTKRQLRRVCESTGFWPMNTQSCVRWGRECSYSPACETHEDEAIMKSLYTKGE